MTPLQTDLPTPNEQLQPQSQLTFRPKKQPEDVPMSDVPTDLTVPTPVNAVQSTVTNDPLTSTTKLLTTQLLATIPTPSSTISPHHHLPQHRLPQTQDPRRFQKDARTQDQDPPPAQGSELPTVKRCEVEVGGQVFKDREWEFEVDVDGSGERAEAERVGE